MALSGWPTVVDDSGTGEDGTPVDKAYSDAIKASIEGAVHGVTNPAVRADVTIDEVCQARGSKSSLDARLDVALNEDGTPKNSFGYVTETQAKSSLLGLRNQTYNVDLLYWTNGSTSAPDSWALTGAGAAVAQCGPAMPDTFSFGAGKFCAKVTYGAATAVLTQNIISSADFVDYAEVKNNKVSLAMKVKTSTVNIARIGIDDGIGQTRSSYHTGGGSAEHLTVTHTISGAATKLTIFCEVTAAGNAYFGGARLIFSEWAPSDWFPEIQPIPEAGAVYGGLLASGTQTIPGLKNFMIAPKFRPGTSAGFDATASGRVDSKTADANNAGTAETDLHSYTLPANALDVDGKIVRVTAWGKFANNANNKTLKMKVGATTVATYGPTAVANLAWRMDAIIMRTGAATQKVAVSWLLEGTGVPTLFPHTAPTETLSGTVVIKTTGQSDTASNDVTAYGMVTEVVG